MNIAQGKTARTTTPHIAAIVGVSARTILRWCDAGMDHGRIGARRMVSVADVARWVSLHRAYACDGNFSAETRKTLNELADWYLDSLTNKTEAA
jgi:hypothetical protein